MKQATWQKLFRQFTNTSFIAFLILIFASASQDWQTGPFTWWSPRRLPDLRWLPSNNLGPLSLLPAVIAAGWLTTRLLSRPWPRWSWGWRSLSLPLSGMSLLILTSLDLALTQHTVLYVTMLGLVWLVYLFIINERPRLVWSLVVIMLLNASVGIGQFVLQRDLGLTPLGEPILDSQQSGVSVVFNAEQRWLRGYGLSEHPNRFGRIMALGLLILAGKWNRYTGWPRIALGLSIVLGLGGILVSLSRAAWLALGAGLFVYTLPALRKMRRSRSVSSSRHSTYLLGFTILICLALFFGLYHDTVLGRLFDLDNHLEQRSLSERQRDGALAVRLLASHPWHGVGVGNYLAAARTLDPYAVIVHNVPLRVGAELGAPGLVLWLWLLLTPLVRPGAFGSLAPQTALWTGLIVLGMLHTNPGLTTSIQGSTLFGLVCGLVALPSVHCGVQQMSAQDA